MVTNRAEEQVSTADLHSLVTSISAPTTPITGDVLAESADSPTLLRSSQQHLPDWSTSIFSPDANTSTTLRTSQLTPSHPPQRSSSTMSDIEPSNSRTLPARSASNFGAIVEDMQQAEKDTDDPSTSFDPRTTLYRGNSTTTARLNNLFAAGMPISPSSSRENSYNKALGLTATYVRSSQQNATTTLPNHLYQRGLLGGRHSDINIKVFGQTYHAHRIILDRAPFFASALTEPWCEASQKEVTLYPEEIDSNITRTTFELALKRLYGCHDPLEEQIEAVGLFATGCWLEMQDLIDASVEAMIRRMSPRTLATTIQMLTVNYYGKAGDKVLAAAKAMLCRDGWEMPLKYWDGIPAYTVKEVVGGDGFFIAGEWERWTLAKRLLNRRLKLTARELHLWPLESRKVPDRLCRKSLRLQIQTDIDKSSKTDAACDHTEAHIRPWLDLYSHADVRPLMTLLDEDIHYAHLSFEQLQQLRSAKDMFEVPLLPGHVINGALWANLELKQTVLNTSDTENTLGLTQQTMEPMPSPTEGHISSLQFQRRRVSEAVQPSLSARTPETFEQKSPSSSPRRFWIPNADCNTVVGTRNDVSLGTPTQSANRHASNLSATLQNEESQWSNDSRSELLPRPPTAKQYSTYPPFRFAAEFPNPRTLKERRRSYSPTLFYAGSYWNLYIQKVKSGTKSPQLGVYLHRAKEPDTDEHHAKSSGYMTRIPVDQRIGVMERELLNRNDSTSVPRSQFAWEPVIEAEVSAGNSSGDPDATTVVTPSRAIQRTGLSTFMASTTPRKSARQSLAPSLATALNDSTSGSDAGVDAARSSQDQAFDPISRNLIPVLPPYVDSRATIKTYFKIYGPSKGGRMLSVYESAPDNFNFSQSWGWKSSTLMADDEEEDEQLDSTHGEEAKEWRRSKDGKLRFMVVLGVV